MNGLKIILIYNSQLNCLSTFFVIDFFPSLFVNQLVNLWFFVSEWVGEFRCVYVASVLIMTLNSTSQNVAMSSEIPLVFKQSHALKECLDLLCVWAWARTCISTVWISYSETLSSFHVNFFRWDFIKKLFYLLIFTLQCRLTKCGAHFGNLLLKINSKILCHTWYRTSIFGSDTNGAVVIFLAFQVGKKNIFVFFNQSRVVVSTHNLITSVSISIQYIVA